MINRKTNRKALLMSVLSMVACLALLIGSTFAWFTDAVSTGVNNIEAGNLDVKLYYSADKMGSWQNAEDVANVFTADKWEPGYTQVGYFKVENAGTLALNFKVATNVVLEKEGKNQEGDSFKLSDYLQFGIIENVTTAFANRDTAREAVTVANNLSNVSTGETTLNATESVTFALVVWMPESTGNIANHNGVNKPEIQFGINVIASQATVEEDSYDNTYDEDAAYPDAPKLDAIVATAGTADDLATLLSEALKNASTTDVTITLDKDINVTDGWTTFEIPNTANDIVIDGNHHTITGLDKPLVTGLWGGSGSLTIKNLTISDANIEGYDAQTDAGGSISSAGAFVAYADHANLIVLDNCKLENSVVTSGAEYVGGLIGYSSADNTTITNCSVTGSTITGLKSSAGIIGHVGASITVSKATVTGNNITVTRTGKELGTGAIFGRSNEGTTITLSGITTTPANTFVQDSEDSRTSQNYGTSYGTVVE